MAATNPTDTEVLEADSAINRALDECRRNARRHSTFAVIWLGALLLALYQTISVLESPRIAKLERDLAGAETKAQALSTALGFAQYIDRTNEQGLHALKWAGAEPIDDWPVSWTRARYKDYTQLIFWGLVVAVVLAMYRFHMNQVVRNEHARLGFRRLRIALEEDKHAQGTKTELRREICEALCQSAFSFESKKKEKIENPLPGHPASDLASQSLNKFFDAFDFKATPKK